MKLSEFAALTDVGSQREHNQDAYLVLDDVGIIAVADGMGGLEHGEIASGTAIDTLRAARDTLSALTLAIDGSADRGPRSQLSHALELVTDLASQRIQQVTKGAASGTTLVVAAIAGGQLIVANTGDSRAYLLRDGRLRFLTDDHTVAAARLRAGMITQAEHDVSPYQHMLYQALGTQSELNPDIFDEPLAVGDVVLLCSDGLTGPVSEERIAAILDATPDLNEAAQALVDAANAGGGPDNITVVLTRVEGGQDAQELERDRATLYECGTVRYLADVDRRLLRHYMDFQRTGAGEALDTAAGVHLLLSGQVAVEGCDPRGVGEVAGLSRFAGDDDPQEFIAGPEGASSLVLSLESYDALERRRPLVAARLMHGLLEQLAGVQDSQD